MSASEVPPGRRPRRATVLFVLALAVIAGGVVGLGGFTFIYGEGYSYFFNDPEVCINCHVMNPVYDAWAKGSHQNVAVCNDCHTPHSFPMKYVVKGINGWNHSVAFTRGDVRSNLSMTDLNRRVTNEACLHCHAELVSHLLASSGGEEVECIHCHAEVGHSH